MEKNINFSFLIKTSLFLGITETEAESMLNCLQSNHQTYKKNDVIYHIGDRVNALGLVLYGGVNIETADVWGNRNILDNVGPGQVFAETFSCLHEEHIMVDVVATEDSEVLFLRIDRLLTTCSNSCKYHSRLIYNLMSVMARKNLNLTHKIFHTAPKSIRDRLLSYLSFQAIKQGRYQFEIPFNRQQLADYLCVDRSAMSNELSKMKHDGLLAFKKNVFHLREDPNGADGTSKNKGHIQG